MAIRSDGFICCRYGEFFVVIVRVEFVNPWRFQFLLEEQVYVSVLDSGRIAILQK